MKKRVRGKDKKKRKPKQLDISLDEFVAVYAVKPDKTAVANFFNRSRVWVYKVLKDNFSKEITQIDFHKKAIKFHKNKIEFLKNKNIAQDQINNCKKTIDQIIQEEQDEILKSSPVSFKDIHRIYEISDKAVEKNNCNENCNYNDLLFYVVEKIEELRKEIKQNDNSI